ncbi:MAG: protease modulator HflC [Acetobacteraceae bacterium]
MKRNLLVGGALALVVLYLLGSGLYTVRLTQEALITQFGKPVRVVSAPGLHLKIPFVQTVHLFDKRLQKDTFPSEEVILGDQKRLIVEGFVIYRIIHPLTYYQAVGPFSSGIIPRLNAAVSAAMRNILASVPLTSVLASEKTHIMARILAQVRTTMAGFGVEIRDVRISRSNLPVQNTDAVLSRMTAERERVAAELRAKGAEAALKVTADAERTRTILLATAEAQAAALRGEGEAQAIATFAAAVKQDPHFFRIWRTLEAYRQGLARPGNRLVLSPSSPILHYLAVAPTAGPP